MWMYVCTTCWVSEYIHMFLHVCLHYMYVWFFYWYNIGLCNWKWCIQYYINSGYHILPICICKRMNVIMECLYMYNVLWFGSGMWVSIFVCTYIDYEVCNVCNVWMYCLYTVYVWNIFCNFLYILYLCNVYNMYVMLCYVMLCYVMYVCI